MALGSRGDGLLWMSGKWPTISFEALLAARA